MTNDTTTLFEVTALNNPTSSPLTFDVIETIDELAAPGGPVTPGTEFIDTFDFHITIPVGSAPAPPPSLLQLLNPTEQMDEAPPSMNPQNETTAPIFPVLSDIQQFVNNEAGAVGAILALDVEAAGAGPTLAAEEASEIAAGIPASIGFGVCAVAATVGLVSNTGELINGLNDGSASDVLNGFAGVVSNAATLLGVDGPGTLALASTVAANLGASIASGDGAQIVSTLSEAALVGSFAYMGFFVGGGSIKAVDAGATVGEQIYQSSLLAGNGLANGPFNTFLDGHPELLSAYNTSGWSGLLTEMTNEIWQSAPQALQSAVNIQEVGNSLLLQSQALPLESNALSLDTALASSLAITVTVSNPLDAMMAALDIVSAYLLGPDAVDTQTVQDEYFAITRTDLAFGQATSIANTINAGTSSVSQFVNSLFPQIADTTIPAVAVEASMYGVTGASAEITSLVTNFLPAQVADAIANGYNPQIYACETLGLVFAFGNETGSTAFANNYGPSNAAMPNTTAGNASFAAAVASLIFGSAETSSTVPAIEGWVSNWEAFYTANGIAVGGITNPTANQIDLAARGAAWGDAIGLALYDNLGPFPGQVTNFLEDAAQGTAVYGAPLSTQPTPAAFQGAATASVATTASHVQVTGVAAPVDHAIM